jgi:hypothetical protein
MDEKTTSKSGFIKEYLNIKNLSNIPLWALVAANLLPIYGVTALGWDVFNIVFLYWMETLVIGFYSTVKIASVKKIAKKFGTVTGSTSRQGWRPFKRTYEISNPYLLKLLYSLFFVSFFGLFCSIYGVLIVYIFDKVGANVLLNFPRGESLITFIGIFLILWWASVFISAIVFSFFLLPIFIFFGGPLVLAVYILFHVISHYWATITTVDMLLAIFALFASHGVSYIWNFLVKGEYASASANVLEKELIKAPFSRIFFMHIEILPVSLISLAINSPTVFLVILIFSKVIIDSVLHLREHKKTLKARNKSN